MEYEQCSNCRFSSLNSNDLVIHDIKNHGNPLGTILSLLGMGGVMWALMDINLKKNKKKKRIEEKRQKMLKFKGMI